jgi:hypothetical protein
MEQFINGSWIRFDLPLENVESLSAYPVAPNYLFLIELDRKEMFLVQASANPEIKSLGIYDFKTSYWHTENSRHYYRRYHFFETETLILSVENEMGEKSKYKLDIPSFSNAKLVKLEDMDATKLVCNIQKGLNFGTFGSHWSYGQDDGYGEQYIGLPAETIDLILSKGPEQNNQVYVDGDYTLLPMHSGQDAFYSGLDLYKNESLVKSINLPSATIGYVEVERDQGIIFDADESGQSAKSAIYYCFPNMYNFENPDEPYEKIVPILYIYMGFSDPRKND